MKGWVSGVAVMAGVVAIGSAQPRPPAGVAAIGGVYPPEPMAWNVVAHPAAVAFAEQKIIQFTASSPYLIPHYRTAAAGMVYPIGKGAFGASVHYEQPHPEARQWTTSLGYGRRLGASLSVGAAFHYHRAWYLVVPVQHRFWGSLSVSGGWRRFQWGASVFNVGGAWSKDSVVGSPSVFRLSGRWQGVHGILFGEVRHAWGKGLSGGMGFGARVAERVLLLGGIGGPPWRAGLGIEVEAATFTVCLAMEYHHTLGWSPSFEVGAEW